jgi:hypothetical protein
MKELLNELENDINNCGIDASYEGDNFEEVNEAIKTLNKVREQLNIPVTN